MDFVADGWKERKGRRKKRVLVHIYRLFMRGETLLLVPFPSVGDSEQISVPKIRLDYEYVSIGILRASLWVPRGEA